MYFISLLLGILVDRYMPDLARHRGEGWYRAAISLLLRHLPRSSSVSALTFAVLAVLLPASLVFLALGVLWDIDRLFGFITSFVVFLFMLGPRSLFGDLHSYMAAVRSDDGDKANDIAASILDRAAPENGAARTRQVIERLLVLAGRRIFGVIFWAAILGPAGAVMFRASDILRHQAEEYGCPDNVLAAAERVYGLLEWAPSRLLALSYALSGSFDEAMAERQTALEACTGRFFEINEDILACTGRGALALEESGDGEAADLTTTENLLFRTLVIWISGLAVLSIFGVLM